MEKKEEYKRKRARDGHPTASCLSMVGWWKIWWGWRGGHGGMVPTATLTFHFPHTHTLTLTHTVPSLVLSSQMGTRKQCVCEREFDTIGFHSKPHFSVIHHNTFCQIQSFSLIFFNITFHVNRGGEGCDLRYACVCVCAPVCVACFDCDLFLVIIYWDADELVNVHPSCWVWLMGHLSSYGNWAHSDKLWHCLLLSFSQWLNL